MKKVLIVGGDAVEALEIFYPYYRLKEEGFEVHVAAPTKKELHTVVHDFEEGWETYTEKPGYLFRWVDKSFAEVDPKEYDGLFIPGGRAPEYIRNYPELEKIVKHFFEANKPVAAICHGPQILTAYGLLKGRKVTCYVAVKPDVVECEASYEDAEVVKDGKLVTSRAWPDLPALMKEFISMLKD
ncbi:MULTISPECIES: DJ-1/PfpI family protein [unclassified Archaeoglobus]|jgi:protease I|uniref:DJ-1/PfpI family protein n=1 Tax=unclassified Archaeoglobus TaxID=2643606 RepID=UPI0025C1F2C3|nr:MULTISPECIES: DJ-1/PfpI family protein [unclassified Archaeoglobus]